MHIQLEVPEKYSIQSYDTHKLMIDSKIYEYNLIVSQQEIIQNWQIETIDQLSKKSIAPLLKYSPKIILIGHNQLQHLLPSTLKLELVNDKISLECMSIAAACRTFNILLNEHRAVALGIVFAPHLSQ